MAPISTSIGLRITGGVLIGLSLVIWIVAVATLGAPGDTAVAWALLGGLGILLGSASLFGAHELAIEQEVERLRGLGVRVAAPVTG